MNLCKFSLEPHHCLFNIWLALDLNLHKMEMEEIYQITFIKMWQLWKKREFHIHFNKTQFIIRNFGHLDLW